MSEINIPDCIADFGFSLTRYLPFEIWQGILWMASGIGSSVEFTTYAEPYKRNTNLWSSFMDRDRKEVLPGELTAALQTRLSINRVCKVELPELETLYSDTYDLDIVAGKVTRVGWDGLPFAGSPSRRTIPTEGETVVYLRYLLSTFNRWRNFPTATTYSIAGWQETLEWLEEQPDVIRCVAECQSHGVKVEFTCMSEQPCSA